MTTDIGTIIRETAKAIRPHVETLLDLREIFADYRAAITDAGGDWMALKNLVKAQIEDERDGSGEHKRVARIIDRADFASAYADILGMNENNSFSNQPRVSSAAAVAAVASSGPTGESANTQSESRRRETPAGVLPEAPGRTEGSRPQSQPAVENFDDVASTESRRDEPHQDLAAGDESPLLSEPVAFSRETVPPVTDAHGFMVDDMPAFLERASA